ncbi:hypothetical protein [Stakelama tenebrarum]|uniref:Uncharacterized protein n=1 Tax=Stakelama tenebrarum TaxID=2711215 RepID=A0A6G6Y854_9SPHN|nr:hypothetical protein [Sphingosinithalassobacter tenebrarum]QIG81122.1 hypothetical protein G5C33_15940 [Sphingosinithalassobacter tenebrarum]
MDRKTLPVFAAIALIVAAVAVTPRPHADIQLMTHDAADTAPHKLQAAVDLGVVVISFLYTWTGNAVAR